MAGPTEIGEWLRRIFLTTVLGFGLIATGCSTGSDEAAADSTTSAPDLTRTAPTTSSATATTEAPATTVAEATTSTAEAARFIETSDVVYMNVGDVEFLMDIYTPAGVGPWPVVVVFHGLDSHAKDAEDAIAVAE